MCSRNQLLGERTRKKESKLGGIPSIPSMTSKRSYFKH